MQESLRYVVASLALGAIAYFGSEAFFWVFLPDDTGLSGIAITILAYGLSSACALSAVILTRANGFAGLFLAASILGFLVEGVVVATMYDAFPFQLVWTPLAWHALVTGLAVFALHRMLVHRSVAQQVLAMIGLGLFGGLLGGYWAAERTDLPEPAIIFAYLAGTGMLAVAGQLILDKLIKVPRPPQAVLWVMPVLAALLWLVQAAGDPRPQRLALPVLLGLSIWAMRRTTSAGEILWGRAAPLARHCLFLIAPVTTAAIAAFLLRGSAGFEGNAVVAGLTFPAGLGLWLWCLWFAWRARGTA